MAQQVTNLSLAARFLISLVKIYKLVLSPLMGGQCRFYPTCSSYSQQAIAEHGAAKGLWLTISRILRCNPFCKGGEDPISLKKVN